MAIAVAAASTILLLAFSARAAAEVDTGATTSSAPAGEGSAPLQTTSPPAPVPAAATSEPAEAAEPDAVSEIASVAAESKPPVTRSAAPHAIPTHPSPADPPAPEISGPASGPEGATAVPSPDHALELPGAAHRVPAEATAAIVHSAGSTAEAVDRVSPVDAKAVNRVASADYLPIQLDHPLQVAHGVLPSGILGVAIPKGAEDLRWPSGTPLEVGADAFSLPSMPAIPATAPVGSHLDDPVAGLDDSPIGQLLDFAGVEPLPPMAPDVFPNSSAGRADLGRIFAGAVGERYTDLPPPDGMGPHPPHQAPGLPQGDAAGGGISFIPIAALLALLALAAPAIRRRLGEGPDFRLQTPFVCALERPG